MISQLDEKKHDLPEQRYKRSDLIAELLLAKLNQYIIYGSIFTNVNRILYVLMISFFIFASDHSETFRSYPQRLFFIFPILIMGIIWILERVFNKFSIKCIEETLVRSEMSEIGREYNPWSNAYIQTRQGIEGFGGRISVGNMLDFEPVAWIALSSMIIYLC